MISLYVFDMDGTLIDSGEDIADCVNATLSHFGYFNVPTQELISFTGDGARALIIRALKSSTRGKFDETTESGKRKTEEILAWYLSYYGEHPVTKTKTYAGIPELLKVLSKKERNARSSRTNPSTSHEKSSIFSKLPDISALLSARKADSGSLTRGRLK